MNFESPNFALASAEIFVLTMACVVLLFDVFSNDSNRRWTYYLSIATVVGAGVVTWMTAGAGTQLTFSGTYVADHAGLILKMASYVSLLFVFIYSMEYLRDRLLVKGEYFVLALFALLGIMVMISASHFLTIYLGLELLSLSLYAMVAFDRDSPIAAESAMKYFVLGAIASGTLLYGMSMLYGVSGSLDLATIASTMSSSDVTDGSRLVMLLGLSFVLVGMAFKMGAVPFHMWIPDVYHGAPTASTLFIGSTAKIASFALMLRLLIDGLGALYADWRDMIMVMSVLSIVLGNIVAIAQTNLKRMLAYSTISHVGFILMGFLAPTSAGVEAALLYTIVYVIMSAGAFGMIILLGREGFEADEIDDFKGLFRRSPWFAMIMMLIMFSMAGVPPLVGFYPKLNVIMSALNADLVWVAVVGVIFSVVGAFYYLRVIKVMLFDEPAEDAQPIEASLSMRAALSVNGLSVLVLGLLPGTLIAWVAAAF
ncbi:MAG: NADH-quinone oxidoreductase subunit NuoN [Gammaproteobacteria bacterium]